MKNTDYDLAATDARELMSVSVMPDEFRRQLLNGYLSSHGTDALIALFSSFIGLSNSVVASTRDFVEQCLIDKCGFTPEIAAQINLPTIQGALEGATIAVPPTKKMCGDCAFRAGSPANHSYATVLNAEQSLADKTDDFFCHHDMDANGEPTKLCAGFARAKVMNRNQVAAA